MHHELEKLAYRLPGSVTCQESKGSFQLVLGFPLKAIFLHLSWKPVFELLSGGDFVPLEKIVPLVNGSDPDRIELFLNDQLRKGFLEQEGASFISEYPFVSIIIPVRNRPLEIKACLGSLAQLVYPPKKLEIIVVDDASTDNTAQTVSGFPVHLLSLKENKQAPFCRNLGAQKATGSIMAFLDSDCVADPMWLKELIPAFKDPALGAAGGLVDSYFNEKALDRYEQVKSSLNMGPRFRSSREHDPFFYVPSCNLLIRKEAFLNLGGFREELIVGEDVDFCWRMEDAGYPVEFRPVGRVYHKHRNKLIPFCLRRFDYGTSEPLLQRLHLQRRKEMVFPLGCSLFWSMAILTAVLKSLPLLALCGIIALADTLNKLVRVKGRGIGVKFPALLVSVIRGYFAFFYHCSAFVSRYYLGWAILVFPLSPLASIIGVGMHILAGLVEYFIKRPRLNPFSFLFYFSLEQLSYQSGVWWECIKHLSFNPVNPRVTLSSLRSQLE